MMKLRVIKFRVVSRVDLSELLARAVGGTDFRPSTNGGGSGRGAAHSLRECRRARARRRGQAAEPRGSGCTESCTHVDARGASQ